MIAFSCAHCGMKFSIKDEFAGRQTTCPTCRHPLVVPQTDSTVAFVAPERIDGQLSSLARAGIDPGVTLGNAGANVEAHEDGQPSVRQLLAGGGRNGERYLLAGEIARGGMGAVLRAVDCDIRREVAVKYLLDQADPHKKARFIEEAQITGQLEHPNIVPIHELGVDAKQRLFFSMKMVKGRSLQQVLAALRDSPRSAEKEYSLTRLLAVFVNMCHALAYAHSLGVVHRDLKPANIMLGDFGEVYVMDWGLAKVLQRAAAAEQPAGVIQAVPSFAWADEAARASPSAGVKTSRVSAADQTMDGAVLGTPLYMPSEQALGDIAAIDQRSDIYSLGAILYEMLTLQPPIDKQGGHLAILLRVSQGEIIPPQQRDPARTKAGKVPKELAAVASKALARDKTQRYATVEALRRDIERYLEGRSVSAKEDSKWETTIKFVKRNKGFSAGAATSLFVLVCSLWFLASAWLETKQAYAAYQKEQGEKERRTKEAVPVFVAAARMWGEKQKPAEALIQVDMALDYDPEYPPAHLLKGQVLIAQRDFASARAELDHYLMSRPDDAEAKELRQLCHEAQPDDGARLLALVEVLLRHKALGLSDCLMRQVSELVQAREKLLPVLRKRIEASWPGLGDRLKVSKDGRLTLQLWNRAQVRDLSPLRGMPLNSLELNGCNQVRDLTPLQGMPLTFLDLGGCNQVRDLTPLQGMPLTRLSLWKCDQVRDLMPLQGMKLTSLNLHACDQLRDLTPLHGMPLISLDLGDCGQVQDLTPLQGMPLTSLNLGHCDQVRDLTPLQGMPLTRLNLMYCAGIHDLTPLRGMKLTRLAVPKCITDKDLTKLQGMRIASLEFSFCNNVQDLTPLKGMPLTSLTFAACGQVRDLTPLKGMPLASLYIMFCGVRDLTPLQGMELQEMYFQPKSITKGMDILRQMKSLKTVGIEWHRHEQMPAAEFWKRYDAGEFPQDKK